MSPYKLMMVKAPDTIFHSKSQETESIEIHKEDNEDQSSSVLNNTALSLVFNPILPSHQFIEKRD